MNGYLLTAVALLIFIAAAHSILGERYILVRLLRRDNLPRLFGGDWFTKRTLRFAWHVTSVTWLGFAGILVVLSGGYQAQARLVLEITAITFLATALIAAVASHGRHLSWIVFLAVAVLAWIAR